MRRIVLTIAIALLPVQLWAEDVALILGVERYEQLDRVSRADDLLRAQDGLERLGFTVRGRANPRLDEALERALQVAEEAREAERVVIALAGHFVTDGRRSWLLTAEADDPGLFTVDDMGLSVDSLLAVLAGRPGQALLVLGEADPDDLDLEDSRLRAGLGALHVPQGVTVVQAAPSVAATFLREDVTEPEGNLGAELMLNPSLRTSGYRPMNWVLMPGEVEVESAGETGPTEAELNAEAALWDRTTEADDVAAYRAYIRAYPDGRFVDVAEEKIAAILAEPDRNARLEEEALNLNRAARRAVQADLTVLGYDTRGVDGIFGPGSRRAITNWQQSNGYPQTSYLTLEQVSRLNAQAERRRAEIAAEEERARAEAERLDRNYWAETGAKGDEPGYRAYLSRYPDGLFSEVAEQRLAAIEAERREAAEIADRTAWGRAVADDTIASYQDYLASYPNGVFAEEARERIAEIQGPSEDEQAALERAQAQERALGLNGVRAQLLELRLRDLGYNPGRLDGVVDENTRAALRAYQADTGVAVTGYVDQETLVQLMAGTRGQ